mgnify:CR=1 FL=1
MDELLKDAAPAAPATPTAKSDIEAIDKIAEHNADETQATDSQTAEPEPVTLGGTAVSPGARSDTRKCLPKANLKFLTYDRKTQTRAEFTRLRAAVHTVDKEFGELIEELSREEDAPTEAIAFLELHRQLLNDESIITETQDIIRERLINAEWALSLKLEDILAVSKKLTTIIYRSYRRHCTSH